MSMQAGKQEEDQIPTTPLFVTTGIIVVIMVLTFIGVSRYAKQQFNPLAASAPRPGVTMVKTASNGEPLLVPQVPQFGMLHQTLFDSVSDAKDLRAANQQKSASYGWNDEKHSSAHIPVERAMELVVQQRAAGGGGNK